MRKGTEMGGKGEVSFFFSFLDSAAQYGVDKAPTIWRLSGKVRRVAAAGSTCQMARNWQLRTKDYESPFSGRVPTRSFQMRIHCTMYMDAGDNGLKSPGRHKHISSCWHGRLDSRLDEKWQNGNSARGSKTHLRPIF